jgi:hypothetical protein
VIGQQVRLPTLNRTISVSGFAALNFQLIFDGAGDIAPAHDQELDPVVRFLRHEFQWLIQG